ncbi:uncharacterized protein LOC106766467 isoform X3 [Vigna radiata var. radiata]|uniref:Uncharacterized protein LOC106766467 isoform X3 n=1 Tax=Vigna radiata var. radiata TaxID=3916 RepID=A0A3Q0EV29_VIGRR|nr:uncharacterized protein LOC106766467 isoform X3 [Vigna radiata var. radiata]
MLVIWIQNQLKQQKTKDTVFNYVNQCDSYTVIVLDESMSKSSGSCNLSIKDLWKQWKQIKLWKKCSFQVTKCVDLLLLANARVGALNRVLVVGASWEQNPVAIVVRK